VYDLKKMVSVMNGEGEGVWCDVGGDDRI